MKSHSNSSKDRRVVTTSFPMEMVARMDEAARHRDRSKSWIVRQAVSEWLAEEQRRDTLTREALNSVDEGRTYSQEEIERSNAVRKLKRMEAGAE